LFRRTTVADADGFRVASIRGLNVYGRANHVVAIRHDAGDARAGVFVGPAGIDVGHWRPDGAGTVIEFADALRDEPFTKMGLLAAVLADG
jgi:hypothetical protein